MMRPRSLVLLSILLAIACPRLATATQPRMTLQPDTTHDEPPRIQKRVPAVWRGEYEGLIFVSIHIDTLGNVTEATPVLPVSPSLEAAVTDAARRCTFMPARKRGRAIETPWSMDIELRHPRSPELAPAEDTLSVMPIVRPGRWMERRPAVALHASVTYDSVTTRYRYTYELRNRSNNGARVIGFALMGTKPLGALEELGRPAHWNAFLGCGGRNDMLGWMVWVPDSKGSLFGHATRPGRSLEPMGFESPVPPGRVRWVADMARSPETKRATEGCFTSNPAELEGLPLAGWTVGPAEP